MTRPAPPKQHQYFQDLALRGVTTKVLFEWSEDSIAEHAWVFVRHQAIAVIRGRYDTLGWDCHGFDGDPAV